VLLIAVTFAFSIVRLSIPEFPFRSEDPVPIPEPPPGQPVLLFPVTFAFSIVRLSIPEFVPV
jgi:hypothetical protein